MFTTKKLNVMELNPSRLIQAAERPVGEIFSDAYRFSIPRYQRPYAWTVEQAGEMLDDLLSAARYAMMMLRFAEIDGGAWGKKIDYGRRWTV